MAKILLGIALVVMLATAALGFLAKGNIDKLQTSLKDSNQKTTTAENNLRKSVAELQAKTEELTAATGKVEEKDKELAAQIAQVEALKKAGDDAKAALDAKTAELVALNDKINKMGDPTVAPEAGATEPPALKALRDEVARAQAEVAESKSLVDALTQQKKAAEDKIVALEQYKKARELSISRPGLTGRILAVNAGWNFVVSSIGDKQGAVMNASLLVVRGGTPIAKARITSVEPSTSIADIIPGSLVKGTTVQPGDTVVFEGRTNVTQPAVGASAALPTR